MLEFDESEHKYRWNGKPVPSVTQVLAPLYDFSDIHPDVLDRKSAIGTAVHYATELYDAGTLDEDTVSDVIKPYLDAWIAFRERTRFEPVISEQRVFNQAHMYAGTLDRVGILNDRMVIIDIKTTVVLSPAVGVQLVAYQKAIDIEIDARFAVQLKKDGKYVLSEYKDPADWPTFLSLLTIKNFRERHNMDKL